MTKFVPLLLALLLISSPSSANLCLDAIAGRTTPPTKQNEIKYSDPHRWLETDSAQRTEWLRAQNGFANNILRKNKSRKWWGKTLYDLFDTPNVVMTKKLKRAGQSLQLIDRGLHKPTELVLKKGKRDEKILFTTADKKLKGLAAVTRFKLDPKQKYALVWVARRGSIDTYEIKIIDIKSGREVDSIKEMEGNGRITWLAEDVFTYKHQAGRDSIKLIHRIGDKGGDRILEKGFFYNSSNGKYVLRWGQDTLIRSLNTKKWQMIRGNVEKDYGQVGKEMLIELRGKTQNSLAKVSITKKLTGGIKVSTPQHLVTLRNKNLAVIKKVIWNENRILVQYSFGPRQWIEVFNSKGEKLKEIELPDMCTASRISFEKDNLLLISFTSQIVGWKNYKFDLNAEKYLEGKPARDMLIDEKGREFVSEYVEVKSKDGAMVPVRLTYKKGLERNGDNPVLIEGYGGFNKAPYFYPSFKNQVKHLLNHGGIYVAPALRGGSELGPKWHEQGKKKLKQNVFNDLFATTEYLISENYSNPKRIAAMGWSNGGLLMGVAATQRPELFSLVVAGNGVQDMLRREHLDPEFGDGWSREYGHPTDVNIWPYFKSYSPVHNTKDVQGARVLVIVGQNDSRVDPAHSYKLAAALQKTNPGKNSVVLSSSKNSGHWMTYEDLQDLTGWSNNVKIWSTIYESIGISAKKRPDK